MNKLVSQVKGWLKRSFRIRGGLDERLRQLFQQAPAAIAVLEGKDLVYVLANPMYQKVFNRTEQAMLGKSLRDVFPELKGQGIYEIFENVFSSGESFSTNEFRVVFRRSETEMPEEGFFNFVVQPIKDGENNSGSILIHAIEVTELVRARQQVQESEEKYRSLFTSMDQGFCILEVIFDDNNKPVDYRFLESNPTFEEQTGLKNAIGKTARELVPDLEEDWFEIYGKVALTGESLRFTEGSDAMDRWFDVHAFHIGGTDSHKVALLFTDITERKKYERELQQKNQQLVKTNADLDNFIYTASHDLKAPISNIEGLANSLSGNSAVDKDDVRLILGMMDKSIVRFKRTIQELTDIAKVHPDVEAVKERVRVKELVEDIKTDIKDLITESGATVFEDFPRETEISFSRKNLRSILYNLISNAIKYRSPERKPVIRINVEDEGNEVRLSVQDNGLGIKEEDKKKVFTMFKRLHSHVEGTGVGMAIVKRIVDSNGGRIEIDSEVGKGSEFIIYLKKNEVA